ncbi:MAG: FHA domain-containing protein [Desulfobulbaceae bacterium]|nr:FHA domain-containing protein [Desulfobulbaceae bacterium]
MSLLAAHLNDAGVSFLDSEAVLYREPGFALLDDDQLTTGSKAFTQARIKPRRIHNKFWSNLDTDSLPDQRFRQLSAADLVSRQLEQTWARIAKSGDQVVLAVPAYMKSDNLGLLLGIAAELNVPVIAMVDAAVAATRRHYKNAVPVHIDFSLHSVLLTRISQAAQAQVDRSVVVEDCGVLALNETWIGVIAEAFVQQSRFDPLHTAETEQVLQDSLSNWLTAASAGGKVAMTVNYRGISHRAELDTLEFVAAAAPIYHQIISNLRALFRADEVPALQLTDRAARLPGFADTLGARVGGELFMLESGATARGLLARCQAMTTDGATVNLVRQLPWDQSAIEIKVEEAVRDDAQPTHLLFDNIAYAIDAEPLTLGSQPTDGERCIDLQQSMPGVSRRHCSLQLENGQCVVRDFSRYGTFLNGHQIDSSAVLQVGDLIRLGTPGYELRLIATESAGGS